MMTRRPNTRLQRTRAARWLRRQSQRDGSVRRPSALALVAVSFASLIFVDPARGVSFAPAVNYGTQTQPAAVAVGDFNGDGKLDLAVETDALGVSILLGKGDGTFQTATTYPTNAGSSFSIAVGDFNGDGSLDLATTSYSTSSVSILLGNGDGTFQMPVIYATGLNPVVLALGDLNGDGKLDLAIANFNPPSTVSILLGNGDGSFQPAANIPTATGPSWLALGDINADGRLDLVLSNTSNIVSIMLGNGDGTFKAGLNYTVGPSPGTTLTSIIVGDFNRDGTADLAVANNGFGTDDVAILLGSGNEQFRAPHYYLAGKDPVFLALADFNGDGKPDLAVANNHSNDVSVLLGNGDGTFQPAVSSAAHFNPSAIAVGDFNGDGRPDLVVANYSSNDVSILLNTSEFVAGAIPALGLPATGLLILLLAGTGFFALRRVA